MAASLLTSEPVTLENAPEVRDVTTMARVLQRMGASDTRLKDHRLILEVPEIRAPEAPYELVKTMRASILVLGPLLARCGEARVSLPGGCAIGLRPVDQHIKGLAAMGAEIVLEHAYIHAQCGRLRGAKILFDRVTVSG